MSLNHEFFNKNTSFYAQDFKLDITGRLKASGSPQLYYRLFQIFFQISINLLNQKLFKTFISYIILMIN